VSRAGSKPATHWLNFSTQLNRIVSLWISAYFFGFPDNLKCALCGVVYSIPAKGKQCQVGARPRHGSGRAASNWRRLRRYATFPDGLNLRAIMIEQCCVGGVYYNREAVSTSSPALRAQRYAGYTESFEGATLTGLRQSNARFPDPPSSDSLISTDPGRQSNALHQVRKSLVGTQFVHPGVDFKIDQQI